MPKNKIQFQHGLSLPKFLKTYGTELQCKDTLFQMRWRHGFVCPKCGGAEYYELKVRELYQCKTCHRQTSVTCGTIVVSDGLNCLLATRRV